MKPRKRPMKKIYVASSWRNTYQPGVVGFLRDRGHQVYDFRHPFPDEVGFSWSEVDPDWRNWSVKGFKEGLRDQIARHGFSSDMSALRECDVCVMVLPCGASSHLELGYAVGSGARSVIYIPGELPQAELMYAMADDIVMNLEDLDGAVCGTLRS